MYALIVQVYNQEKKLSYKNMIIMGDIVCLCKNLGNSFMLLKWSQCAATFGCALW